MAKVALDLISDVDLYLFFSKSMKGGVYHISKRYNKINNKYLKPYDQKLESKHNIYLDATNLHVYEKSKFLLTSGFKWVAPNFDSNKYNNRSDLEVDLEYPRKLQELHDHYPFDLDKIEIKKNSSYQLSSYQLKIANFYITIGTAKNWCLTFSVNKSMHFITKTYNFITD